MEHVIVFREEGRFGGWPANNGIWSWQDPAKGGGDEIVVGFNEGALDRERPTGHPITLDKDSGRRQARSLDGGRTWEIARMPDAMADRQPPTDYPSGITFTHQDFALKTLCSGVHAGATSWFYISYDRCTTWEGPYRIPMFGLKGIAGRTDYQVLGHDDCILFLAASKPDGYEGRAFCARTTDGGKAFQFLSWIGPELPGWTIMPASVRLAGGRLLAAVRCNFAPLRGAQVYSSDDDGRSWQFLSEPVPPGEGGNPPAMIRLADGRICMTWGWRREPYGIRAWISEDDGKTWADPIVLRDDGGCGDLGYTRTVQRSDGKIVTVYYFNDPAEPGTGNSERYIAGTIWSPDD